MARRLRKKLLITGCGRSGTKYTSVVLRILGLDVRHEKMGRDGIASWCLTVDEAVMPWGPSRRDYRFDHIFHQVRNPLHAIPSMATFKESSWELIYKQCPCSRDDPLLLRCARYWYFWNRLAERISEWRFRIEQLPDCFDEFCSRLQIPANLEVLDMVANDVNTRRFGKVYHRFEELCLRMGRAHYSSAKNKFFSRQRPPIAFTWEKLRDLDSELEKKIRAKSISYGYSDQS